MRFVIRTQTQRKCRATLKVTKWIYAKMSTLCLLNIRLLYFLQLLLQCSQLLDILHLQLKLILWVRELWSLRGSRIAPSDTLMSRFGNLLRLGSFVGDWLHLCGGGIALLHLDDHESDDNDECNTSNYSSSNSRYNVIGGIFGGSRWHGRACSFKHNGITDSKC